MHLSLTQPYAKEGTGTPFVLVDNHNIVVEDRVVHDSWYDPIIYVFHLRCGYDRFLLYILFILLFFWNLQLQVVAVGKDVGRHDFDTCAVEVVEDVLMQLGIDE